jgi:hypothetical protein
VEQTEQTDAEKITIRYAKTDEDVCAIHQFLLIVAQPQMRAPVDPIDSLLEIIRVTKFEIAIMAECAGRLIGTLGLIHVPWWYAPKTSFMVDRWHFVLPQFRNGVVNRMLIAEADSIADAAGIEFIEQGPIREKRGSNKRLMIFPRSTRSEQDTIDKQRA